MDSIGKCLKMLGDTVDGSEILRKNQSRVVEILLFTGFSAPIPGGSFSWIDCNKNPSSKKHVKKRPNTDVFSTRMLKGFGSANSMSKTRFQISMMPWCLLG